MNCKRQEISDDYALYNGDSVEIMKDIPEASVGYIIYSPPFSSLYTYSNSIRDLGNCKNDDEFFEQFSYMVKDLFRVLKPGRLMSVHCMDIPMMKERDGVIGLKDFPGELIKLFQDVGFIYHSRVCIWKDPLVEATRTKSLGLMHKQICKDSSMCRQGLPDYLITMRKPGENKEHIEHPEGFTDYIGADEPKKTGVYSHEVWRKYASPIWMDIDQSNTLNRAAARDKKDEKHICPLQLDVIARGIELWSNPGDVVLSPFGGIGSEPYVALKMKRKAIAIELKDSYYDCMIRNCMNAISTDQVTMAEMMEAEHE